MLWLGVRLPYLGLDVFDRQLALSATQPAVVAEDLKIHLLNEAAKVAGIKSGASLATARSIEPDLVHFTRDPEVEAERLGQLVNVAYEFTPSVSKAGMDALLLEIAGSLKLFGGVLPVVQQINQCFRKLGHITCIGIAHTPRAALVFTRSPLNDAWPEYPTNAETHQLSLKQLKETPLSHLEVGSKDRDRLMNMGLLKVGELLDIPRHELSKRFSKEFIEFLAQLTGELLDPWEAEQPVAMFNERIHLIEPLRGKEEVVEPMEHLATAMGRWLDRSQLGVRELRWGVYAFEGDGASFEVNFEQPRYALDNIMAITRLRMEVVDLPEEAMTVALEAIRVESRAHGWVAHDILGGTLKRASPPRELIERLTARLGPHALQQFQILDDHRPEFTLGSAESDRKSKSTSIALECGRRPLWLLEPPRAVKEEHLHIVSGPERIESGWWDIEQHRDYYIARDESESWCWCFRDAQGWFLHGYFG